MQWTLLVLVRKEALLLRSTVSDTAHRRTERVCICIYQQRVGLRRHAHWRNHLAQRQIRAAQDNLRAVSASSGIRLQLCLLELVTLSTGYAAHRGCARSPRAQVAFGRARR